MDCPLKSGRYLDPRMSTQEIIALGIVAGTALAFLWRWRKRRRNGLPCGDCGCAGSSAGKQPESVLKARKGERARLTIKK